MAWGLAFSTWSLTKLAEYLAAADVAVAPRESIQQILHDAGINWLATKTWKASTDPQLIEKMRRVLDLYDHPPADGRVICAVSNARAQPKTNFAPSSVIRTWASFQTNVA